MICSLRSVTKDVVAVKKRPETCFFNFQAVSKRITNFSWMSYLGHVNVHLLRSLHISS